MYLLSRSEQEEARINLERCEEILECKRQIQHYKSRLDILEQEQGKRNKLAKLRLDARATWRTLTRQEKLDKEFVLAAMQSTELPAILEDFPNSAFPPNIRLDRDILLARVARSDFADRYKYDDTDTTDGDRLFVPQKLRGDRQVIQAIVRLHPQVIECISCELRDDEEIVHAFLENQVLPKHFMQHFSERIRADSTIMSIVLQHPYGLSALKYSSREIRDDKEFLIQILNYHRHASTENPHGVEDVLRHVSQRLRADADIVQAAVQMSGLNLKHAAYPLRRDQTVVLTACQTTGSAFRYCLAGPLKEALTCDRAFVLQALQNGPSPSMLQTCCLEPFNLDQDVQVQALKAGMEWSDIDDSLQDNIEFVLRAVSERPDLYMDLSVEMREMEEIALQTLRGKASEVQDNVILEATERVPSLLSHREAMLAVAKNDMSDVFQETLQFSPIEIRSDKEIMLAAVKHDATAFEYCSDELQNDRDIIQAAVESCPTSLYVVSEDFQSEHPDIVITAIERTDPDELWTTYDDIHNGLWQNKDVAQAWLKEGGDWLDDDFPEEFCEDEDLMLTVAEYNWTEFEYASDYLKGDKKFMLKAVAKDGRVFNEACYTLRNDFDLALAAFSKSREAIQFFSGEDDFEFMVKFSRHVWERLAVYDVFTKQVLGAIDIKDESCCLSMLNQGPETCLEYKQVIASYLGLPHANELKHLQEVSQHLRHWGL